MFLQRNTAGQVFTIPGTLRAIADGSAVTSGATLTWIKDGTSAASAGTLTHVSDGGYTYSPTQGETDAKILGWVLTKTGAAGLAGSVRTTNADPNDAAALGLSRIDAAVSSRASAADYTTARAAKLDNLDVAVSSRSTFAGGAVASVTGAVGSVAAGGITAATFAAGAVDATAFAQGAADKVWSTTTRQLTGTQTFNLTGNVTGNLSGSVGSVIGAAGAAVTAGYDQTHSKGPWPNATAWVNFDEGSGTTAADATGNGNGFTLVGAPTWGTHDSGPFNARFSTGSYLTVNGSSQYANGAGTILDVVPDAWCISFDFIPGITPTANKRLMSKYNTDGRDAAYNAIDVLFDNSGSGSLKAALTIASGGFSLLTVTNSWTVGRRYRVSLQYGKDRGYELWIDDVLEAFTATATKPGNGTRAPLTLGAQQNDATVSNYFNGSIDNFRYFPALLSPQQIAALARAEPTYPQYAAEDRVTAYGAVILPGAGDQTSAQEANVLYNAAGNGGAGLWEALVHCGWTTSYFRYYSSPDGLTWTRGNVMLGNGTGGESSTDVGRGSIVLKAGTYYKFYDTFAEGIVYATATAMAGPWTRQAVVATNASVSAYGTRIVGPAAYWDAERGLWVMIAQIFDAGGIWRSILLTGATLGTLAIDTTAGLLTELQAGNGTYGGYYLTKLRDGRYVLLYHTSGGPGNIPSVGRAATSWDGRRWAQYPIPIRQIRGEIANQQQVADPWAVEANGRLYVYYSLTDNTTPAGKVAVMTFAGTLDDWLIDGPPVDAGSGRISQVFTAPRQALVNLPVVRNFTINEHSTVSG